MKKELLIGGLALLIAGCAAAYKPKKDFTKQEALNMLQQGINAHTYYVVSPKQRSPQTGGREFNLRWTDFYIWLKKFVDENYGKKCYEQKDIPR